MQRVRRPVLAVMLAGAVVLMGACSQPGATVAPDSPPGSAAATSTPASSSVPAPTASPSGAPSAASTDSTDSTTSTQPPPTAGSDPAVEPSRSVRTAPPKKLDESTRTAGAVVSLVSVRATTIRATAPGDRSGPGVLVRLKLVSTGRTLDTSFTHVDVTDEAGTSGTLVDGPPTHALDASVRAGRATEGTYAFLMDDAAAGPVTVSVFVTSGQPVVTFRGRAR